MALCNHKTGLRGKPCLFKTDMPISLIRCIENSIPLKNHGAFGCYAVMAFHNSSLSTSSAPVCRADFLADKSNPYHF